MELKQNIRLTRMIVRQPDTVLTDGTKNALLLFAERQCDRVRDRARAFMESNLNSIGAIRQGRRVPVEDVL